MLIRAFMVATGLLLGGVTVGLAADVSVSLEVVTERGFAIDGPQRWQRYLQDKAFGLSYVRIRSARSSEEPKIVNRGTESAPRYQVTAVLTANGRLVLPGLAVRYGQRKELTAWLDKLRRGGDEAVTAPTGVFGLRGKQLAVLHDALKRRVAIPTKGKPVREVVQHIQRMSQVQIDLDASAKGALSGNNKVLDELEGLSCGTALAVAVRPYGLSVTPTGQGTRSVGLRVTKNAKPEDVWPIGRRAKSGAADLAPELLKFINVEIVDQPLDDTLDTIQRRLKIPFLYDHNTLARQRVNLHDTVSLPIKKTFYKEIIDQLLFQKLLVADLRSDEAGAPFLWITSAKR